jgi:hypothetical protein
MKHISLKWPSGGGLGGISFIEDPGRYVKKVSGCGISLHGGPPFHLKGTWYVGGLIYWRI